MISRKGSLEDSTKLWSETDKTYAWHFGASLFMEHAICGLESNCRITTESSDKIQPKHHPCWKSNLEIGEYTAVIPTHPPPRLPVYLHNLGFGCKCRALNDKNLAFSKSSSCKCKQITQLRLTSASIYTFSFKGSFLTKRYIKIYTSPNFL